MKIEEKIKHQTPSSWKVRFIDYPAQFRKMEQEIMETIHAVLSQGDLIMRAELRSFEENFSAFVGTKYAVGVANCTDGLHLCLRAAGIGPGDEVISVSHTFVATIASIHHTGAKPVLIDIGDDHNMNVDLIEPALTPRTKAIIPVHLNGHVCQMDKLMKIAEHHKLIIIEDAAQALGGSFQGKRAGSFGLAGCFSFYPAKLLGAFGDAGAVTTNSEIVANKIRSLRDHGRHPELGIEQWSFNSRMDNVQAALLDLKLKKLESWIERRRELAAIYHEQLSGVKALRLPVPPDRGDYYDAYQNYEIEAENRDALVAHLKTSGIEILVSWGGRGVHQFQNLELGHYHLPRTDELFRKVLMLPLTTELTEDQILFVCDTIKEFYE